MKLPLDRRLTGVDFELRATAEGTLCLQCLDGAGTVDFGTALVNDVDEKSGLLGKLRWHSSEDALSGRMELETVLPFGAEFTLNRQIECFDGVALVTVDLRSGRGGRVRSFELEPLRLRGDWKRVYVQRLDGARETVALTGQAQELYAGAEPWLKLQVEDGAGRLLEVGVGDDLWRWFQPENGGSYRVEAEAGLVTVRRRVLALTVDETVQLPLRAYRFQWFLAWSAAAAEVLPPTAPWRKAAASTCLKAAATQRMLKQIMRSAQADVVLDAAAADTLCRDAAHLERPNKGELLHQDVMECARFYLWSNRELIRRSATMRWNAGVGGGDWALAQALSRVPRAACVVVRDEA